MEKYLKLTGVAVLLLTFIGLWNCRNIEHDLADLQPNENLNPNVQTVLITRGGHNNKNTHADKLMELGKKKNQSLQREPNDHCMEQPLPRSPL